MLKITATYTKTDDNAGVLTVSGNDNVAVIPAEIHIFPADSAAVCNNKTYAQCSMYKKVGESFVLNAELVIQIAARGRKPNNFNYSASGINALPVLQHKLTAPSLGTAVLANTTLAFSGGFFRIPQ